jgi:hypothetical protein
MVRLRAVVIGSVLPLAACASCGVQEGKPERQATMQVTDLSPAPAPATSPSTQIGGGPH